MAKFSFADLDERNKQGAASREFRESVKPESKTFTESQLSRAGLPSWLDLVREQPTIKDVLRVVEGFQKLGWTDAERAAMSQAYMRRVEALKPYE